MFNKFLKLHDQLSKKRRNDFITLLEYLQDVKDGKMDQRIFESTYPILKERIKYYDGCIAGLEHGFFNYYVESQPVQVSIDIPADEEYAEEFKEIVASRLNSLVRLAQMNGEEFDEESIFNDEEDEQYASVVKAFKTHSELGGTIAQAIDERKANKIYQKIKKKR